MMYILAFLALFNPYLQHHRKIFSSGPPATTVTEDGTGYTISGSGSKTFTLSSGISAGNGVIVIASSTANAAPISACSDNSSPSNGSYSLDEGLNFSGTPSGIKLCSVYAANSLTTITVTATQSSTRVHVLIVNNFASSSWADTAVVGTGTQSFGTSASATAGAAVTGTEVVIAACMVAASGDTMGFSSYSVIYNTDTALSKLWGSAWKEVASGTPSQNCTSSGNTAIILLLQGYKE
ncbi:hypothetical protein KGP36_03245 [Patescibacteria group bacterium]|nr:hypothetical protein [Patescibacteria group bacterium]